MAGSYQSAMQALQLYCLSSSLQSADVKGSQMCVLSGHLYSLQARATTALLAVRCLSPDNWQQCAPWNLHDI